MLPSSRLPEKYRSMVRFAIVGLFCTALQYSLYWVLLLVLEASFPSLSFYATVAFTLAFIMEAIVNYILTAWYTFSTRPTFKNAGGFVSGRAINYPIQIALLQLFLWVSLSEQLSGILAILLAGVINYFIFRYFFRPPAEPINAYVDKNTDENEENTDTTKQ